MWLRPCGLSERGRHSINFLHVVFQLKHLVGGGPHNNRRPMAFGVPTNGLERSLLLLFIFNKAHLKTHLFHQAFTNSQFLYFFLFFMCYPSTIRLMLLLEYAFTDYCDIWLHQVGDKRGEYLLRICTLYKCTHFYYYYRNFGSKAI